MNTQWITPIIVGMVYGISWMKEMPYDVTKFRYFVTWFCLMAVCVCELIGG